MKKDHSKHALKGSALRRTVSNSVWMIAQSILLNLVSIFAVGYIARNLGENDYGIFIFAASFVTMFLPFVNFGIRTLTVRMIAEDKTHVEAITGKVLGLRVALAIIVTLTSMVVINLMDYPALTKTVVYITAITILLRVLATTIQDIFQAYERMKYIAYSQFFSGAILTILSVAAIYFGYHLIAVTWAYTVGSLFTVLIAGYFLCKEFFVPKIIVDREFWRDILVKGLPFFLPGMIALIGYRLGVVFLSKMAGNVSVGAYGAAANLIEKLYVIPDGIGTAIFPTMAALYKRSIEEAIVLYQRFYLYLFMLGLPLAVGTTILAKPLIFLIYGNEYQHSVIVLQILICSLAIKFLNSMQGWTLGAIHQEKATSKVNIFSTILLVLLNLVLIPNFKEAGAAAAYMISTVILFVFYRTLLKKNFTSTNITRDHLMKVIFSNVVMGIAVYFLRDYPIIVPAAAGVSIYGWLVLHLNLITKEEILKFVTIFVKRKDIQIVKENG